MRKGGRRTGFRGRQAGREVIRSKNHTGPSVRTPYRKDESACDVSCLDPGECSQEGWGSRTQRGPAKGKGPPDIQGKVQGARKPLKDDLRQIQNFHSLLEQKLIQIRHHSI